MTVAQLICALGSKRLRLPTFLMVLTVLDAISWTGRAPHALAPLGHEQSVAAVFAAMVAVVALRLWFMDECRVRAVDWFALALYVCYRGACGDLKGYGLPFLEVAY